MTKKTKRQTELDVDFIGGQGPEYELTKEEKIALSNYIRADKAKRRQLQKFRAKTYSSKQRQTAK